MATVEYCVAGALITITLVAAFTALGGSVEATLVFIDSILPG
jgi:Flp pilus assembly pilin Flp